MNSHAALGGGGFLSLSADLLYYLLLLIFIVHVLVLAYHWHEYGTSKRTAAIALAAYLSGAAVLFIILSVLLGYI